MGVGRPDCYWLQLFGERVRRAFGHVPYQVGSSLTKKRGWRDVDVRLILPDDEYEAWFGDPFTPEHKSARRIEFEMAWSALGRTFTGLPIDFQIQQQTLANEEFNEPRSALRYMPELDG